MRRLRLLAALLASLGALATGAPSHACSNHGASISGDVTLGGPGTYDLRLSGFTSFGYEPGHYCGCGVAVGSPVRAVTAVQFVLAGTQTPLPGSGTFLADAAVTTTLERTTPAPAGTGWFGFKTMTTGSMSAGVPIDILMTLEAEPGSCIESVRAGLQTNVVGTGETNAAGTSFISHFAASVAQVPAGGSCPVAVFDQPLPGGSSPSEPTLRYARSYPNPSARSIHIEYSLARASRARVAVFATTGRLVRAVQEDRKVESGVHRVPWDGLDRQGKPAPAGVYFYRVLAGGEIRQGRIVLLD